MEAHVVDEGKSEDGFYGAATSKKKNFFGKRQAAADDDLLDYANNLVAQAEAVVVSIGRSSHPLCF